MDEVFADKLININVTGRLVRLDFASAQPQVQGIEPIFNKACSVIMPLEAFLKGFKLQEEVLEKLVTLGVLTKSKEKKPLGQFRQKVERRERKIGFIYC